jgi:hypothetical protein
MIQAEGYSEKKKRAFESERNCGADGSRATSTPSRCGCTRLIIIPGQIGVIAKFPICMSAKESFCVDRDQADLGLMRCVARNTVPSKRHRPPTTR